MLNIAVQLQSLMETKEIRGQIGAYMRQIYSQIDREVASFGNICENCKRCCDFEHSKLDLFVSNIEFAYFLMNVSLLKKPRGNICPYLTGAGCSVRDYRPIGCRTYFCKPQNDYSQMEIYERSLSSIKAFVSERNLPYSYYPWIETLNIFADTMLAE